MSHDEGLFVPPEEETKAEMMRRIQRYRKHGECFPERPDRLEEQDDYKR